MSTATAAHTTYSAAIRRVSDGEVRVCPQPSAWRDDEYGSDWYWWTDGNYGCDCNRHLEFERAGGHSPQMDDDNPCGESRYAVLRFEFPDGSSIAGPDADGEPA